jgi:hypothetical protein
LEVCIKALSHKRKLYLDRYARTLVRRAKLYSWKRKVEKQDAPDASGSIWSAPEVFALSGQHRSGFLVALALLRQKVGVLSEDVVLDFSKTTHLFADGMLLFYAELKRLIHATRGSVNIGCTLPENSKVAQVLEQVGVLRLLNVRTEVVPVDHDVVSWKAASGHLVLGDKYDEQLVHRDHRGNDECSEPCVRFGQGRRSCNNRKGPQLVDVLQRPRRRLVHCLLRSGCRDTSHTPNKTKKCVEPSSAQRSTL